MGQALTPIDWDGMGQKNMLHGQVCQLVIILRSVSILKDGQIGSLVY